MKRLVVIFVLIVCCVSSSMAGRRKSPTLWVDSVVKTLTLEQQVAQLFVVRVPFNMSDTDVEHFASKLEQQRVGGVCFFAGYSERQLEITRMLQSRASIPLMVCMDAEWGLGMRLKDAFSFPRQAYFDSMPDYADTLLYFVGQEIGRQCRMMGIHVNFAPVVDVNSNPLNPVIGRRSFSADPERVARLGIQYMKGMQSQGVMAVAKHFPGHGDTKTDSHKTLPTLNHCCSRLDSVELYPFRRMVAAGVDGVMVGHLCVPAYDTTPCMPASLSESVVNGLLRQDMGFRGLVFTDGMEMGAVKQNFTSSQAALMALRAGNDILLLPGDLDSAVDFIVNEAQKDPYLRQLIKMRCRQVLRAKYKYVLPNSDITQWRVPALEDSLRCSTLVESVDLYRDGRIEALMQKGLDAHAYPGCQVLVMRHGEVLYRREMGRYTYDEASCKVDAATMYDLASVTKVCATTLAVMHLVDNDYINLDDKLSAYLPYLAGTNKENITIRQALSHIAGLKAFDNYWEKNNDPDEIRRMMAQSALQKPNTYLYSDLGFIFLADMVHEVSGISLDSYMQTYFYDPMGLSHTTFLPLSNGFEVDQIAPTEDDSTYRHCLIHGMVHDQNAFALGGVAGHAGLFSNVDEVAALLQMLLDGGVYRGERYLSQAVIDTFNSRHYTMYGNRRALGFDKPNISSKNSHVSNSVSQSSFGHTGFTGTMIWVDPEYDLVYVFLSNRVHPSAKVNLLARMNIRTDIQDVIYDVLDKYKSKINK